MSVIVSWYKVSAYPYGSDLSGSWDDRGSDLTPVGAVTEKVSDAVKS